MINGFNFEPNMVFEIVCSARILPESCWNCIVLSGGFRAGIGEVARLDEHVLRERLSAAAGLYSARNKNCDLFWLQRTWFALLRGRNCQMLRCQHFLGKYALKIAQNLHLLRDHKDSCFPQFLQFDLGCNSRMCPRCVKVLLRMRLLSAVKKACISLRISVQVVSSINSAFFL